MLALELLRRLEEPELFHQLLLMSATADVLTKDTMSVKDAREAFVTHLAKHDSKPIDYDATPDKHVMERVRNASVAEILLADKESGLSSWDFELKRPTLNTTSPLKFDTIPRHLFGQQRRQNNTRILLWSMRDEWSLFEPKVRTKLHWAPWLLKSNYGRNYIYIPFRQFVQPYLARYGYHLLPAKSMNKAKKDKFHFDEWFDDALRVYGEDLKRSEAGKEPRNFDIYIQIMSDWVFTLRVAKDARRFAARNRVWGSVFKCYEIY